MTPATRSRFPGQYRAHVGLPATDVERSIHFYQTLLGCPPSKRRPGYAKFEPSDPCLNLSLNQVPAVLPRDPEAHYGIEAKSSDEVLAARDRLQAAGYSVRLERQTACCYAVQDKLWAADPDGHAWEVFVVLQSESDRRAGDDGCCSDSCCSNEPSSPNSATAADCGCRSSD